MYDVVLATANLDKANEIKLLLKSIEFKDLGKKLEPVEEYKTTIIENARLKAREVCKQTGCVAISDDTGIEVFHLNNAPGVYSARFAGKGATNETNVQKLLETLSGISDRRARFVTAAVAAFPDGREITTVGYLYGKITEGPRGEFGFGYDVIFEPDQLGGQTLAEIALEEKNRISHRSKAFLKLEKLLVNELFLVKS
jgi:XTP/dITP diphosphohydrolase